MYFLLKQKPPFCQERINRKCQRWTIEAVFADHTPARQTARYISNFFFKTCISSSLHLPYSPLPAPLHSSVLLIYCSLPSSSIPPSSPHSMSLISTRSSSPISPSLTPPSISHSPASFHPPPPPTGLPPSCCTRCPSSIPLTDSSIFSSCPPRQHLVLYSPPPISSGHTVQVR